MDIVFGWNLDGHSYPATATGEPAAINQPVVGPKGMLELLEMALGLSGPTVPAAVRIAHYQGRLSSLDDGKLFYSRSFARDAWATSKQILAWRDELYASGWRGQPIAGGKIRLETMAALENVGSQTLGRCIGERLHAIIDVLRNGTDLPLKRVALLSPEEYFPKMWRTLFASLKSNGVGIRVLEAQINNENSDLATIQKLFRGEKATDFSGDGSLVVLDAEDEWQAADVVAAWLASGNNDNTVIIRGHGCPAFDAACHRQSLPRPGLTESSSQRSVLQVLPLALETLWNPLDPARILEFLSLPSSPLPQFVSRRFARALMKEPGIGGELWIEAWSLCIKDFVEWRQADGLDDVSIKKESDKAQKEWRFWLEPKRFLRSDGIPVQTIQDVCRRIAQWSAGVAHKNNDNIFLTAAAHAAALSEAMVALGVPRIKAVQLGRIIDAITAEGVSAPEASEEAAPWTVVDAPGQIWNTANSVVWWGFTDDTNQPAHQPWSKSEIEVLAAANISIEPAEDIVLREANSWRQAIMNVKSQVILVMPRRLRGEATSPHPLWHEIFAQLESLKAVTKARVQAQMISVNNTIKLADRVIMRQAVGPLSLPAAQREWIVPPATLKRRPMESITSIKTMIECPLAWSLEYGARIKSGALNIFPDDERLVGILAHAVVESLFAQRKDWQPDDAAKAAAALFDSLAVTTAAPLLRQGYAIEYGRAKSRISDSISQLVKMISDAGLTVRGCEEEVVSSFAPGQDFGGYLDLVLEDANGRSVVLDLKWSKRDKYLREEIRDGRALQLAAYTWLEDEAGRTPIGAGYFMLRQQTLLYTQPSPFSSSHHVPGSDLKQTWTALRGAYNYRMAQLETGNILVRGIEAAANDTDVDPMPQIKPGCKFCDYRPLCGAAPKGEVA